MSCALLGAIAGEAFAAPAWLPPETLSLPGQNGEGKKSQPKIALDGSGNVSAVWLQHSDGPTVVQAASRPAGGAWPAPEQVEILSDRNDDAKGARIAVNPAGDAVAAWRQLCVKEDDEGTPVESYMVLARYRPAGGDWSVAECISRPGKKVGKPRVAIDGQGNAYVIWPNESRHENIDIARRSASGGEWVTKGFDRDERAIAPQIAVNPTGEYVVAVWLMLKEDGNKVVRAVTSKTYGESWLGISDISGLDPNIGSPHVDINADGETAVAIWQLGADPDDVLQAAVRKGARNDWDPPEHVYGGRLGDLNPGAPHIAMDSVNSAVAVWEASDGGGDDHNTGESACSIDPSTCVILASQRVALGGTWSDPETISDETGVYSPRLAINPTNNVVAVWMLYDGSSEFVQAAMRPSGGEWQPPATVSGAGTIDPPDAAIDPEGNAVAIWSRDLGTGNAVVQAAAYDAASPRLDGLSVPQSGAAGEPLDFSVSPFDVWARPDQIRVDWSFGDSGATTGAAVTHAYMQAGTYQVTVTATDLAGNSLTKERLIAIAVPPLPPGADAPPTPSGGQQTAEAATLSRVSLKVRCLKTRVKRVRRKDMVRRVKVKRLLRCKRGSKLKRRLVVRFTSSAKARVKVRVRGRFKRSVRIKSGKRRSQTVARTVVYRTLKAREGRNRYVIPARSRYTRLFARQRGRLRATVSVVGAGSKRRIHVSG